MDKERGEAEPAIPATPSREYVMRLLSEFLGDAFFAEIFMRCAEIIRVKNADYSQNEQRGDRIAAFRRIARDIGVPMEKVWAVFAQKHWGAIMRFVKDGRVESEPIEERVNDLINYLVLLRAIIVDGKGSGGNES